LHRIQKVIDGTPVIVVRNGEVDGRLLRSLRMMEEDLLAIARQNGAKTLDQVELGIVERDGNVSLLEHK
jgi:uncharacterized membrane protein YcaP (DUF421 family)